jgi:hypothetical protein
VNKVNKVRKVYEVILIRDPVRRRAWASGAKEALARWRKTKQSDELKTASIDTGRLLRFELSRFRVRRLPPVPLQCPEEGKLILPESGG